MIEREDYEAFVWIRDNVGKEYPVTLLDPWKATAFTAITQKQALHRMFLQREPVDDTIYQFLRDGCPSNRFLKDNGSLYQNIKTTHILAPKKKGIARIIDKVIKRKLLRVA